MSSVDLWIIEKNGRGNFSDTKKIYTKILNKYTKINSHSITYNTYGKPMIYANHSLFFNISHTSGLLLVAVTHECEIGIDVELKSRKISRPLLLAKKFFHTNEIAMLQSGNKFLRDFISLWVIKEAYVKMNGYGINYGLNNFYVDHQHNLIYDSIKNNYIDYHLIEMPKYCFSIVPKFNKINFHHLDYDKLIK
jgi:4'-phosphopantetheinyl transferase